MCVRSGGVHTILIRCCSCCCTSDEDGDGDPTHGDVVVGKQATEARPQLGLGKRPCGSSKHGAQRARSGDTNVDRAVTQQLEECGKEVEVMLGDMESTT